MVSDSVSDLLVRIKNGYLVNRTEVQLPWSKLSENLVKVLVTKNYLGSYEVEGKEVKNLKLMLKYNGKQPAITQIRRVSKPSLRIYAGKNNLPKVLGGLGIAIISTPAGLMVDSEARKKGLGGEVMCEVW